MLVKDNPDFVDEVRAAVEQVVAAGYSPEEIVLSTFSGRQLAELAASFMVCFSEDDMDEVRSAIKEDEFCEDALCDAVGEYYEDCRAFRFGQEINRAAEERNAKDRGELV